jgi:hypothetical protein
MVLVAGLVVVSLAVLVSGLVAAILAGFLMFVALVRVVIWVGKWIASPDDKRVEASKPPRE